MSCKKCEEFQAGGLTSYFRWGNTNIEVRACDEHLTEVFAVLRGHAALKAREADLLAALEDIEQFTDRDVTELLPDIFNIAHAAIARAKA